MNLKEFISESLTQIIDGVADAQSKAKQKNATINPGGIDDKRVHIINFDIAVTVTETTEKSKGLGIEKILVANIGKTSESMSSSVSRIKFDIPLKLPYQYA